MKIKANKWRSKKAAIGATIDWIIGTPLIVGILVVLIIFSLLLFVSQGGSGETVQSSKSSYDLISLKKLISFLKTPIEADSNQEIENIHDLILASLDSYIKEGQDITSTVKAKDIEFFIANPNAKSFNNALITNSQNVLGSFCENYMLRVPQGIITPDSGVNGKDFFMEDEFESIYWTETFMVGWGSWVEIELPYKGQIFKVRYRQLKKC